jgi:PEP-CTERM motif-containing protein
MKGIVILSGSAALCITLAQPAYAAFASLPTFGLAVASVAVGVLGAAGGITGAHGGGAGNRVFVGVGGTALGIFDPLPGTFYSGSLVINYPADLLSVAYIGWFGNFAVDPSVAFPPETAEEKTGFYDSNGVVYDLQQAPNPLMTVTTTNIGGVLTVNFVSSAGITSSSADDFNFMDVGFTNISGNTLNWGISNVGEASNYFLDSAASTLTCIPNAGPLIPVACGGDTLPIYYTVGTPEPSTWAMMLLGFAGLGYAGYRRAKEPRAA